MKGSLWLVAVVGVVLAVGFLAFPTGVDDAAQLTSTTDEVQLSTTPVTLSEADNWYDIEENETVQNDTTEFERGTDYLMDYENGTIEAIENSDADGETVDVEYYWHELDQQTEEVSGLLALFEPIVPLLFLLVCLGALWAMMGRY